MDENRVVVDGKRNRKAAATGQVSQKKSKRSDTVTVNVLEAMVSNDNVVCQKPPSAVLDVGRFYGRGARRIQVPTVCGQTPTTSHVVKVAVSTMVLQEPS